MTIQQEKITILPKKKHLPKLDVLRGIAILGVFLIHQLYVVFGIDHLSWNGLWLNLQGAPNQLFYLFYPLTYGWSGVSLFFVLSGFVIHLSYLNSKEFTLAGFYWRRFWRIYPPYLLALIFCIVLFNLDFLRVRSDLLQVLSHLLLIHNFHEAYFFGINSSFWSLANEMQFYLLYPLLLIARKKNGMKRTLLYTFLLSLLLRVVGCFFTNWDFEPNKFIWWSTPITFFDWTLGVYLAEQHFLGKRAFTLSSTSIASLCLCFFLFGFYKPAWTLSFPLSSLIWAVLIEKYLRKGDKLSVIESMFIPLGLCSYSFYLWHQPLLKPIISLLHGHFGIPKSPLIDMTVSAGIAFILLFAVSWLLYYFVENKSRDLGNWLWKLVENKKME